MTRPAIVPARSRPIVAAARALAGVTLAAGIAASPAVAREGDATRGQLLYENHCTGCHTSRAHVRENRKASTRADIRTFVRRWQAVQALGWNAADVEDVTNWLFLRFYDPDRPSVPARGTPG